MKKEVVQLKDVTLRLGGRLVLDRVNLAVYENDFFGIIGPNGGGKTSLLKVILGLLQPEAGEVRVLGLPPQQAGHLMGYVPQYAETDPDFPVSLWDVVLMGRLARRRLFRRYNREDRQVAHRVLAMLGLSDLAHRQIGELSGGQRQRVLIARALAAEPKILLLDEPTASLDSQSGQNIFQILDQLNKEITIILVSHDMGVISRHVQTIACLNHQIYVHDEPGKIDSDALTRVYGCPVDLITHGEHPHRVLGVHTPGECGE